MKNNKMKALSSTVFTTLLLMAAVPVTATPIYAEEEGEKPLGTITCEVKIHENGYTYTECSGGGYLPDEYVQQVIKETQLAWEQETGYTYGVNIYATPTPEATPVVETPAPVHTCQDDGYPAGYYWSESANACVTDAVAPTPVATPVPTEEPVPTPQGGEYYRYYVTHYSENGSCQAVVSGRNALYTWEKIPWNNEKGYVILGTIQPGWRSEGSCIIYPNRTPSPSPTQTPTSTPKPTPKPTSTPATTAKPTSTPSSTPVASTWDYNKVSNSLFDMINEHRVELGVKPLTLAEYASEDATQRANESMEYAKTITAYGTSSDGHRGFDTEWGDNEANGFVSRLTGEETEEEVAQKIFANLTTGVTKNDAVFSSRYTKTALGFTDAYFIRRSGAVWGFNVYFNLLLGK